MATRKWRMREHFRGPVIFGSAGNPVDSTWYGDTASAVMTFDASANELYFDGTDLWLKDDDQLEFGNVSDFVIDWNNTSSELLFLPAAAGNKIHYGSSTLQVDIDWDVRNVDIDLYGTNPEVNITRNLTSGATNLPVVAIKQDQAGDDQVALLVDQDAAGVAGVDFNCGVDIDSNYTAGAGLNVTRNLASGSTAAAVAIFANSSATDDQPTVQVTQAAANVAALDLNGALDMDIGSSYASGVGLAVTRNLTSGSTDDVMVLFEQSSATDDNAVLKVTQAATGYAGVDIDCGVDIDSTYTSAALNVVRNLTSGVTGDVVVYLHNDNSGDNQMVLQVVQDAVATAAVDIDGAVDIDSTYTGGAALDVARNLASASSTGAVAIIAQSNSGDDQVALQVTQGATGVAGVDFDCGVDIDSTYTSAALNVVRNLTSGVTGDVVVYLKNDNSGDDRAVLQVVQDAVATVAVDIDGGADITSTFTGGPALNVDRNLALGSTTGAVAMFDNSNAGDDQPTVQITQAAANVAALDLDGALDIDIGSSFASGAGLRVTRNLTSGGTDAAMVIFEQSNASDDQVALQVTQAATGYAGVDIDCAVDIDSAHTAAALNVARNLTSGVTTEAVVLIHQDQSGDDQAGLKITQDATSALALDANGWCDIGYEAAASPTGTPPTGSVKILYANSRWFWVIDTDGAGTLRYAELALTSTA